MVRNVLLPNQVEPSNVDSNPSILSEYFLKMLGPGTKPNEIQIHVAPRFLTICVFYCTATQPHVSPTQHYRIVRDALLECVFLLNGDTLQLGVFIWWFFAWQSAHPTLSKPLLMGWLKEPMNSTLESYAKQLEQVRRRKHLFYSKKYRLFLWAILVLDPDWCVSKRIISVSPMKCVFCSMPCPSLKVCFHESEEPKCLYCCCLRTSPPGSGTHGEAGSAGTGCEQRPGSSRRGGWTLRPLCPSIGHSVLGVVCTAVPRLPQTL